MTPEQFRTRSFTTSRRGYDRDEVDQFLDRAAVAQQDLQRRTEQLEAELARSQETSPSRDAPPAEAAPVDPKDAYRALGEKTTAILVQAEDAAAEMRASATRDAAVARAEAERYAAETRSAADEHDRTTRTRADEYDRAIRAEADEYAVGVRRAADEHRSATHEAADSYAATTRSEADAYATATRADADTYASTTREAATRDAAEVRRVADATARDLTDQAARQAEADLAVAERAARDRVDAAQAEAQRLVAAAVAERDAILDVAAGVGDARDALVTRLRGVMGDVETSLGRLADVPAPSLPTADDRPVAPAAPTEAAPVTPADGAPADGAPAAEATAEAAPEEPAEPDDEEALLAGLAELDELDRTTTGADDAAPAASTDITPDAAAAPADLEPEPAATDVDEPIAALDEPVDEPVAALVEPVDEPVDEPVVESVASDDDMDPAAEDTAAPEQTAAPVARDADGTAARGDGGWGRSIPDDPRSLTDPVGDRFVSPLREPVRDARATETPVARAAADAAVAAGRVTDAPVVTDADGRPDPMLLRERSLAAIRPGTLRSLRRGLQDLQTAVLAGVRDRVEGVEADDLLPADTAGELLAELAAPFLDAAHRAGRGDAPVLLGGTPDPGADGDTVRTGASALSLAVGLVDAVRTTLRPSLAAGLAAGEPGASLSERVGEVFRDMKGPVVEAAVEQHLVHTYGMGMLLAWHDDERVAATRWMTGEENRCPEGACRANAEQGPVALMGAYPSGQVAPPVHDGCTCGLAPIIAD